MTERSGMPALPSWVEERTILGLLERGRREHPNRVALIAASVEGGTVSYTYARLHDAVCRAAVSLEAAGVGRGDHVGILLSNGCAAEYVPIAFGVMRLGGVAVPLNTRYAAKEQAYSVDAMDCRLLIYEAAFRSVVDEIRPRLDKVGTYIQIGGEPSAPIRDWHVLDRAAVARSGSFPGICEDDVADILLTSGTTGYPKGVMLTHANAVATGIAVSGALGLRETDVYQSAFPLFTSSGFHFNLLSVFSVGATIIVEPEFDVERMLETIARERTTVYLGVPAAYIFMLEAYDDDRHDLSSVRLFDYGGAPMAKEVIRQLFTRFPWVELRQTYGLTEAGPTGTYLPGDLAIDKLGSVGKAMPLCEVQCLQSDLRVVSVGEVGEIVIRGPTVMAGYYKNPEATESSHHDGWLWTGDLGTVDEDGFLYYVDRNKDIIIRGGLNISSMEVENALFEHPDIQEVAVVATPHRELGEDVFVFAVMKAGATVTVEDLRSFCSERLADYKIPRKFQFIDELPRNPTGKIQKNVLRNRVRENN